MDTQGTQSPPQQSAAFAELKGLREYVLQVDANDEQKASELVFIDNPVRNGTGRVAWISFCFFLLFVAFNVAQGAVTTLYPDYGFYSLAIIYCSFLVSSVIAPRLIPRYLARPRYIFSGASLCYAFFVGSINATTPTLLMIASAVVGASASFLWLQQSLYVTGVAQRGGGRIGRLTALFLGILNTNMVAGNLVSLIVDAAGAPTATTVWIMLALAILASVLFLAVPNLPPAKRAAVDGTDLGPASLPRNAVEPMLGSKPGRSNTLVSTNTSHGSAAAAAQAAASGGPHDRAPSATSTAASRMLPPVGVTATLRTAPMSGLALLCFFDGTFTTLVFGNLPLYVDPQATKLTGHVALMFISYGITAALGPIAWGRVFDRRGARALVLVVAALGSASFAVLAAALAVGPGPGSTGAQALWMFVGALCGLTETATATVINTTISVYAAPLAGNRSSATAAAFSAYRGLFCMGFILLSLLGAWQSPTSLSPATALAARVAPPLIIGVLFVISTALALRTASRLPELMQASRAAHPHGSRTVSPADASVISGGGAIMMMAAAAARANDGDDDEEDSEDFALKSFTPTPLDPTLGGGWTNGVPIKSGEVDVATLPVMAGKDELAPVSPNSSNLRATGARVARMLESSGLRVMGAAQQTVRMVAGGDFVALASSGGGRAMGRGIAVAHAHRDDVADDDEEEDLADHAMHLQ